jgi:insulysin
LEPALDRFAQFFISPSFNPDGIDRELNAVHSEHSKNLHNDYWRLMQLDRSTSNPNHLINRFATGDLNTLKEIPLSLGLNIRDQVVSFYNDHYSANLMKLVVYGKESLQELASMVEKLFTLVPNHNRPVPRYSGFPLDQNHFGTIIRVKPVKDIKLLQLYWQIEDPKDLHIKVNNPVLSNIAYCWYFSSYWS